MKNYYLGKALKFRVLISLACFVGIIIPMNSQNYPPQVQLPNVNYQNYQSPDENLPDYLESFTEELSGSTVMRIGDATTFGTTSNRIRHNYSKDQTWNSDETLIKLAGYPAAILDAETYEFLYWSNIPSYGRWSNVQPNIIFGTSGNSFVSHDINTNQRTTLHTFSEFTSVDFGYGESNQSNNDRYVGLIGANGSTKTAFVYDIENDEITGSYIIPSGDLDWFSVSQSGEYAVLCWRTDGSGSNQGLKTFNINMQNERHIADTTPHGDLGYDAFGNEVFVGYGDQAQWDAGFSLFMTRLDGGGITNLFPYVNGLGIWGGHVSCRNLDRPGWAYVSEQCCSSNPVAPREIFAIKLDDSGIIERFGKHHSAPASYLHQTQVVPNRNGTKVIFASNWSDSGIINQTSAPAFVLEYPQNNLGISVNAGNDRQICEGESVSLTAVGSGGTNFVWNTGETESSITVNPNTTTTYTITYSDVAGNSVTDDVTVFVNSIPVANAGNDETINEGQSITLTASGGTSFLWSTGEMSQSITVSPTETTIYSVTVSDNGCSSEPDEIMVTVIPTPIEADAGQDVILCVGESAVLTASGGSDYVWSTGETSQIITVNPQSTTTYTVTVSEGNESDTDSVVVTVNSIPIANAGDDQTIYEGESITLTASGGTSFLWSTGEMSQSITVSPAETTSYSVTVSDNGCSSEPDEITVTVIPTPIEANAGQDVSICQGESTVLTASGGSNYVWSTGETSQSITVNPGSTTTYTVTVSEGNATDSDSVVVIVNPIPTANAGVDVTINEGESTTLTASGGSSYEWSTGETTQSIIVSPAQTTTYSVIVFNNNCESDPDDILVTVIPNNTSINASAGQDVSICQGESTVLTASGGSDYVWSTGETSQSITVNPGSTTTYTVTVSEGNSSDSDSVVVIVNPIPTANAGVDVTINEGESTTLTASGGSSYEWSTGEMSQSITVSPAETTSYSVTVSDNGCSSEPDDITVSVIPAPIEASAGQDVSICQGESTVLTASGGSDYVWSTGETSHSITVNPGSTTTYTVIVSEGNATDSDSVVVTVNPIPTANAGVDVTINEGESTSLTASGGSSYEWSTGETTQSIIVSPAQTTTYSVVVSNGGCMSEADTITVSVEPNITVVNANAGEDVTICQYDIVTLTATGGLYYEWSTGETTPSITVSPLSTSTYSVIVSNGESSDTDSIQVLVNQLPVAYVGEDETIVLGESITLTAEGGNSYLWSNGSTEQNITVSPTETANYSVTVSIGNCSDTDDIQVIVLEPIIAYAGEDTNLCNGESVVLTASGGTDYLWSTGETTQTITVTPEITTQYEVQVSNGIQSASDTVLVTVNECEEENVILESEISVYPNPAQSEINIKVTGYLSDTSVKIHDLQGRQLMTHGIENDETEIMTKTINVSHLPRGIFVLTINQNGKTYSKRIILN
jgi:hypothetical protein